MARVPYFASPYLKRDLDGRRLFFRAGMFSRPYVVPDAFMEARLIERLRWIHRVQLAVTFPVVMLLGFFFEPLGNVINTDPMWAIVGVSLLVGFVFGAVSRRAVADLVRALPREAARVPLSRFILLVANQYSVAVLAVHAVLPLALAGGAFFAAITLHLWYGYLAAAMLVCSACLPVAAMLMNRRAEAERIRHWKARNGTP